MDPYLSSNNLRQLSNSVNDDSAVKQSIADLTAKALKTDDTIVLNCVL